MNNFRLQLADEHPYATHLVESGQAASQRAAWGLALEQKIFNCHKNRNRTAENKMDFIGEKGSEYKLMEEVVGINTVCTLSDVLIHRATIFPREAVTSA